MKKFQLSFKMTCISFGALATTDSKFPFAKKKKTKKKMEPSIQAPSQALQVLTG